MERQRRRAKRGPKGILRRPPLVTRGALVLLAAFLLGPLGGSGVLAPAGASGITMASGATPAGAGHSTLHWGSCHGNLPSAYQCATLQVPVDGEEVGNAGPSFGLALARLPASGTAIGSLFVNPGGPGISAVNELPGIAGSMLTSSLRNHFNIIGFDPPGVGASDPITCLDSAAYARYLNIDPAPTTTAGLNALVAGNRSLARGCEENSGRILPHVSTVAAARDMDRIRQAVGDPTLNYLGFSYGTLLGDTYAKLYPNRVRAMVLDGPLDPALAPIPMITAQSEAIDGQLRGLESSCASSSSCPWHAPKGQTLAQAFQGLLARVRAHPVPVSGTSQEVGPSELLYGTAAGLYSTDTWGSLEGDLADLSKGDGSGILGAFDVYVERNSNGTYQNTFEAESAVDCLDTPAPPVRQLIADGRKIQKQAPVFGLLDLYSEITCALWPVKATGTVGAITAPGSPPIVVVGSTGDPITPYRWAENVAHELKHGVLLTRVGDGHTGYGASSCVRSAVDRYLIDRKAPSAGTRCPSN